MNATDFNAAKRRVGRRRRQDVSSSPAPAPPVALTLIAAEYDTGTTIELTFDRAVDIAGIVVGDVSVNEGPESIRYVGSGAATLVTPTKVVIGLVEDGGQGAPFITLTAGAGNGIVAVDDGGAWAGVTNLVLPFPA